MVDGETVAEEGEVRKHLYSTDSVKMAAHL